MSFHVSCCTERSRGPARAAATINRGAALALLAVTQFVLILDAGIVGVALPSLVKGLGFAQNDLSWVTNAYTLMFGGFLLLGGRLADYLGRRRMFMGGLILFSVASLAGSLVPRPRLPDRRPRRPGLRRRRGLPRRAVPAADLLPGLHRRGEGRAQQGAGRLGRGGRGRRRRRPDPGRHAHRLVRLAGLLLGQRADRRGRRAARAAHPAGGRAERRAHRVRPGRRLHRHRGSGRDRVRAGQRPEGGLDLAGDAGPGRASAWRCWSPSW